MRGVFGAATPQIQICGVKALSHKSCLGALFDELLTSHDFSRLFWEGGALWFRQTKSPAGDISPLVRLSSYRDVTKSLHDLDCVCTRANKTNRVLCCRSGAMPPTLTVSNITPFSPNYNSDEARTSVKRKRDDNPDYAELLSKIESLAESDHITEQEYLQMATILKDHKEYNNPQTKPSVSQFRRNVLIISPPSRTHITRSAVQEMDRVNAFLDAIQATP